MLSPGQTDAQFDASLQNQNLRTVCRHALGGQTVKNLHVLASKFELDQSQRKSSQVNASQRKWVAKQNASCMQVQTLRRLVSPHLARLYTFFILLIIIVRSFQLSMVGRFPNSMVPVEER